MNFKPIIFNIKGREEELSKIKRYIHDEFPVMFYRTDDLIHSKRVRYHLEDAAEDIFSVYREDFDFDYARTLAEVHDDIEIITDDVTLYEKERMSEEELSDLEKEEKEAIPKFIRKYGRLANGYDYENLLLDAKMKKSLEARFVSFFDKFDAAGESCHEIWAGNNYFVLSMGGKDGQTGGYIRRLNEFPKKYPNMIGFFEKFPEYLPKPFDFKSVVTNGKPHTKESLIEGSSFSLYNRWKKIIIKNEGIENLVKQIEFIT